jgi:hypothetical protein
MDTVLLFDRTSGQRFIPADDGGGEP